MIEAVTVLAMFALEEQQLKAVQVGLGLGLRTYAGSDVWCLLLAQQVGVARNINPD
jgi:hypothetical protein